MKKYYFNKGEVTELEYKELYFTHYKKGIDLSPSKFIKKKYYCTSNGWVFEIK